LLELDTAQRGAELDSLGVTLPGVAEELPALALGLALHW
jgi:hypothetical protein